LANTELNSLRLDDAIAKVKQKKIGVRKWWKNNLEAIWKHEENEWQFFLAKTHNSSKCPC
jgi:hypothetical protein